MKKEAPISEKNLSTTILIALYRGQNIIFEVVGNCSQNYKKGTPCSELVTRVTNWKKVPSNTYPKEKMQVHNDNWSCSILSSPHVKSTHYDCKVRNCTRIKTAHSLHCLFLLDTLSDTIFNYLMKQCVGFFFQVDP